MYTTVWCKTFDKIAHVVLVLVGSSAKCYVNFLLGVGDFLIVLMGGWISCLVNPPEVGRSNYLVEYHNQDFLSTWTRADAPPSTRVPYLPTSLCMMRACICMYICMLVCMHVYMHGDELHLLHLF